ncbi:MAG TPA: flagellar biosynthesis protein FlhB [Terriglobia bacterium]|nr:flagellar biosynthesis protein FlhB [Terriglobia bacterium]
MSQHHRTEPATPRRKEKAREKGQVPRSRELSSALALLAGVFLLGGWGRSQIGEWKELLERFLDMGSSGDLGNGMELVNLTGSAVLWATLPLLLLSWAVAVLGSVAQGGLVFAAASLAPSGARLNPAENLKRAFSMAGWSNVLKSLLPLGVLLYLFLAMLARDWEQLGRAARLEPQLSTSWLLSRCWEILWKSGAVFLIWAGVDYFLQRFHFHRQLRMSHQEIREEQKETEGSPLVKGRIRRLQHQMRRRRMLQDVAKATVVITNPEHYAVALKYVPEETPAPVVVAKGRNLLAQQIKQQARWRDVPLVENPPLAQALYRAAEVGQAIPEKLYRAVAEILAFLYRAQAARPPAGGRPAAAAPGA